MTGRPATPRLESLLSEARWLEGLARALVADRDEAEELVQEVWLAAARRPPERVQRPRAWLASVLHNALRTRRRAAGARAERERGAARPEALHGADAHAAVARAEAQRRLVECVLALDEPGRSTVILRYFDGLASAEIARRQGVPDSTVRNRLSDALARLRERLERTHGREALQGLAWLVTRGGSAPSAPTTATAGGLGMAMTGKLVAGALVALAGVLWWSLRPTEGPATARGTSTATAGSLPLPAPAEPTVGASQRAELEPSAAPPSASGEASPTAPPPPPPGVLEGLVLDDGQPCVRPGFVELALGWRAEPEGDGPTDLLRAGLADGHFRLAGLSAGRHGVRLTLDGRRVLAATVVIGEAQGTTLVLEVGSATLSGHVWDEQGLAVAGARLVLAHRAKAGLGTMPLEEFRAESDARGAFAFAGLSAGSFVGSVELPQREKIHVSVTLAAGEQATLDLGLPRPWPLWRGTLRTRSGAEHRGGAAFELRAASGNPALVRREAADDGSFELRLVPGHYRVALQLHEHETYRDVCEIELGAEDLERDLVLPGARLHGRVLRAGSGAPFTGRLTVSVRLEGHDYRAALHGATLDSAGNYAIDALEPGTYLVNAHPLPLVGGRDATRVEVRAREDEVRLDLVVTLP